jgi:putative transposase
MNKKRKSYPSDVSDKEWEILKPLLPEPNEGGNRKYELREIVNGVYYILRTGSAWRYVPNDLPNWQSVYHYFRIWQKTGVWQKAHDEVRKKLRIKLGREAEPSAAILDSQSVKTREKGGCVDMMVGRKSVGANAIC